MLTRRLFYMMIAMVIGVLSVVGLLNIPAIAQSPTPSLSSSSNTSPDSPILPGSPASPNVILYDQYDNPAGASSNSQNFESSYDAYDDFLADDFVVPADQQWNMNLVEVQGVYFNGAGPADSMNVFIYTEAITVPGTLLVARTDLTYTKTDTNFAISISPTIVLSPGKYWISVQANQNLVPAGQWAWTDRTITTTLPAAWQNPGGGFGTPCSSWKLRSLCVGDPTAGDQVFR